MVTKSLRAPKVLVLLAISMPAVAQYVATPQPGESRGASPAGADQLQVYSKNGQTQEQQWADRYECHRWAKTQTGFDPTQASGTPSGEAASRREGYQRAMTACLEGRGYTVRYGAAPQTTAVSEFKFRPLAVQIDGGYTLAAGTTRQYLDDSPNVGFGLTWFPTSAL